MLVSGSLVLMMCSNPRRPYRSAGLNRTCCAGVCGTPPVVTPAVGGGSAPAAAAGGGADASADEGERGSGSEGCGGWGASAAEGGSGDDAALVLEPAGVLPLGARPAGNRGVDCGLCVQDCGRALDRRQYIEPLRNAERE